MVDDFMGRGEVQLVEQSQALEHENPARFWLMEYEFNKETCVQVLRICLRHANVLKESNGLRGHGIQARELGLKLVFWLWINMHSNKA